MTTTYLTTTTGSVLGVPCSADAFSFAGRTFAVAAPSAAAHKHSAAAMSGAAAVVPGTSGLWTIPMAAGDVNRPKHTQLGSPPREVEPV